MTRTSGVYYWFNELVIKLFEIVKNEIGRLVDRHKTHIYYDSLQLKSQINIKLHLFVFQLK